MTISVGTMRVWISNELGEMKWNDSKTLAKYGLLQKDGLIYP